MRQSETCGLALGLPVIAKQTNVSVRSIYIQRNSIVHGIAKALKVVCQGRPCQISLEMEEVCSLRSANKGTLRISFVMPVSIINEQVYFLCDEFDIMVDGECIRHIIKRVQWGKRLVLLTSPSK
jgi:hypothetical protein